MSFATWLALAVGVLAVAPLFAHLLKTQKSREVMLPTARLLESSLPETRKRTALQDRALLGVRVLSVLALALLGATPFVSCSHVALLRRDGASISMVFVVDDSLSMQAPLANGESRFELAKRTAESLAKDGQRGDSFALVLAGKPARVIAAPTSDFAALAASLDALAPSDRATDLAGAIDLARSLVEKQPQPDKRIVVLSDRADGGGDTPLSTPEGIALWYPIEELLADPELRDCAITRATQRGASVVVDTRCVGQGEAREIVIHEAGHPDREVARVPLGVELSTVVKLPRREVTTDLDARLVPPDVIPADDAAPVMLERTTLTIGVVADAADSRVETGGAPPIEQALLALGEDFTVRPLPDVPVQTEEFAKLRALVLDDPNGLAPDERAALTTWVEEGGLLLIALGPGAVLSSLTASFGTLVPGVIRLDASPPAGANPSTCVALGASAEGVADLRPKARVLLEMPLFESARTLCSWSDQQPLFLEREVGRGVIDLVTLNFHLETSDLPVRPAFIAMVDAFLERVRERSDTATLSVGQPVLFRQLKGELGPRVDRATTADGKTVPLDVSKGAMPEASSVGRYTFTVGDKTMTRLAFVDEAEIDFTPRPITEREQDASLGGRVEDKDVSSIVALVLLALLLVEAALRLVFPPSDTREQAPVTSAA